jgi:MFS family permease
MPSATVRVVLACAGIRAAVIGCVGVVFGLYLAQLGMSPGRIGVAVGLGLAGNAAATLLVAWHTRRIGRRTLLIATALAMAVGLAAIATSAAFPVIAMAALVGMVNAMGRDRGAAQTVEQSLLADAADGAGRTAAFVRFTLVQDIGGALGAGAAAIPALLEHRFGLGAPEAYRVVFLLLAALLVVTAGLYRALPADAAVAGGPAPAPVSLRTRQRVTGLAALFALDSLGGGFLAGAIVAYWFFERFGLSAGAIGAVFVAARLLNAASYPVAEWLSRRIGLVRTMVFTHLPTSVLLVVLPFLASPVTAVAVFLVREALVQMDVPARSSYVAGVVAPEERTWALGVTNVARYAGWALGPALAGIAMATWGLGAPLIAGAVLKTAYDLALFRSFRSIRAPEERAA